LYHILKGFCVWYEFPKIILFRFSNARINFLNSKSWKLFDVGWVVNWALVTISHYLIKVLFPVHLPIDDMIDHINFITIPIISWETKLLQGMFVLFRPSQIFIRLTQVQLNIQKVHMILHCLNMSIIKWPAEIISYIWNLKCNVWLGIQVIKNLSLIFKRKIEYCLSIIIIVCAVKPISTLVIRFTWVMINSLSFKDDSIFPLIIDTFFI
jgi:hypothetical protein